MTTTQLIRPVYWLLRDPKVAKERERNFGFIALRRKPPSPEEEAGGSCRHFSTRFFPVCAVRRDSVVDGPVREAVDKIERDEVS